MRSCHILAGTTTVLIMYRRQAFEACGSRVSMYLLRLVVVCTEDQAARCLRSVGMGQTSCTADHLAATWK